MEYLPENIAEIARTYGEISVFYKLVEEGIEVGENAERCLVAISNYQNTIPREIREALRINLDSLKQRCWEERGKVNAQRDAENLVRE